MELLTIILLAAILSVIIDKQIDEENKNR